MTHYFYRWSLRPQEGMQVELRVAATSAASARREVSRFLQAHGAVSWSIESISREVDRSPRRVPIAMNDPRARVPFR